MRQAITWTKVVLGPYGVRKSQCAFSRPIYCPGAVLLTWINFYLNRDK